MTLKFKKVENFEEHHYGMFMIYVPKGCNNPVLRKVCQRKVQFSSKGGYLIKRVGDNEV